jgi:methanethiol S-methyltransferase
MIAWINLAGMVFTSLLFLYFYVRSVSPAGLANIIGPRAYLLCYRFRLIASGFELLAAAGYLVYFFYPLPTPLPIVFSWSWWISVLIGVALAIPSGWLMIRGLKDAGEEALRPKQEHKMYGGIYNQMRHPQAVGEVFLWWVMAFLANSPFLVIFSFVYIPIFVMMCWAEEQDLLLRYGEEYAAYCRRTGAFWPKRILTDA